MTHSDAFRPVQPVRPAAPYVGGKRNLAGTLVRLIETIPHRIYAEPFVGMGGVFLRRRQAAPTEVINDASGDVVTFFRIVQRHYPALADELKYRFTSRAEFDRLMKVDPTTLTDIERAVRFLYLQRTCFGGKVEGRTFGVSLTSSGGRFDVTKLREILPAIAERLAGVIIENVAWDAFLPRYDRPETLFYLDPPYWGTEDYYGRNLFPKSAFAALADALEQIRGRFILSVNDVPETRGIFDRFHVRHADVTWSLAGGGEAKKAGELIVSNVA